MRQNLLFILFLIPLFLDAQVNLTQGLVMYLPFNGNANDASGNGNNGIVNGAILTTDQSGNPNSAYSFNGTSSYIAVPPDSSIGGNVSYTISAQVLPTSFYMGNCFGNSIFEIGNHGATGHIGLNYHPNSFYGNSCLHPFDSTHLLFESTVTIPGMNTRNSIGLPSQQYISKNQWYCVVISYDSTTSKYKLYVNGQKHIDTAIPPVFISTTDSIAIGKLLSTNYPFYLTGKIDEVRFYNRAINDSEVMALCGLVTSCDTIVNFTYTQNCNQVDFMDSSYLSCSQIGSYLWDFGDGSLGSTLQNPSHTYAAGSGSHTVTLTVFDTSNVAVGTKSVTINIAPAPVVDAGPNISVCKGSTVTLQATSSATNSSFVWINNVTGLSNLLIPNPTVTINSTQTFTVVSFDDVTGCSDTDDVTISVFRDSISISANPATKVCENDTVVLTTDPGLSSYSWTPTAYIESPNLNSTKVFGPASTLYKVTAIDANGCVYNDSIQLDKWLNPSTSVSHVQINCTDIQFNLNNIIAPTSTTWQWDFGDGNVGGGTMPIHSYASDGTFYVTVTASFGSGCTQEFYDTVMINSTGLDLVVSPSDTIICPGTSIQLTTSGAGQVQWILNTSGLNNTNSTAPIASPANSIVYTAVAFYNAGCSDTENVTVTVRDEKISILGPDKLCIGSSMSYDVKSNTSYSSILWKPVAYVNPSNATPTTVNLPSSQYLHVSATSQSGCEMKDSLYINLEPIPNFGWSVDNQLCKGSPIQMHGKGGGMYKWEPSTNFNNPFIADPIFRSDSDVKVTLEITGGCKDSTLNILMDIVNESVNAGGIVDASALSCYNNRVKLEGYGGVAYKWSPSSIMSNPNSMKTEAKIEKDEDIYLEIQDSYGCYHYDTIDVQFTNSGIKDLYMPNAFSPRSGDNKVNTFKIMNNFDFDLGYFAIYDRWGNKVWSTNNIEEGWDGKYKNGEWAVVENYVWVVHGRSPCGEFKRTGTVLLLQ